MAIQYSGSTIINTTFTGDTRANIASNVITQLLAAGWVNVSGSGNDQVLKCATTASGLTGLQIAVRVYDPGSGNCARVALRNVSGTRIGYDLYLLPAASKTFRIIANKYQFLCFTPGASAAREFVVAGQLYVPSWLTGTSINAGFAHNNAQNDTDTTAYQCFRNALNCQKNGACNQTTLVSDTLLNQNGFTAISTQRLAVLASSALADSSTAGYRWADNTLAVNDALVSSGLASTSDEAKIQGQMWDACVIGDSFTVDTTISLDGHTWWAITGSNGGTGGSQGRGTLFVAVT
jgi:hypothetical protein